MSCPSHWQLTDHISSNFRPLSSLNLLVYDTHICLVGFAAETLQFPTVSSSPSPPNNIKSDQSHVNNLLSDTSGKCLSHPEVPDAFLHFGSLKTVGTRDPYGEYFPASLDSIPDFRIPASTFGAEVALNVLHQLLGLLQERNHCYSHFCAEQLW